jgi:hypothetical protein
MFRSTDPEEEPMLRVSIRTVGERTRLGLVLAAIIGAASFLYHQPSYAQKEKQKVIEVFATQLPFPGMPAMRLGYFLLSSPPPSLPEGLRTSKTFILNKDDFELLERSGTTALVVETPERRKILTEFVNRLLDYGLRAAGKGDSWYSFRFYSP